MATIVFTGDPFAPGQDPALIEIGGVTFPLGEAVEVSDETLAAKLARHSHFAVVASGDPAVAAPTATEPLADGSDFGAGPLPIRRGPGRPRKYL